MVIAGLITSQGTSRVSSRKLSRARRVAMRESLRCAPLVHHRSEGRLRSMTTTIDKAIHLVSSDSASGGVMQAGARRIYTRSLNEQLTAGPCDVDPDKHVELRRAWNAEHGDGYLQTFGIDELRVSAAGHLPVVVWATRAYADLVWLWWILDGLVRIGPPAQPPLLVRPVADDPLETVGGVEPEVSRAAFDGVRAISDAEFREGAELWRLFASPDPRAFDEARRRGSSAFPELHESAESHGVWFPRPHGDRIRLSEYDQCLLDSLTDEWLMPCDLLSPMLDMPEREVVIRPFGAYYVPVWRLRVWADRGVVAREYRGHANGNLLEQDVFRLTDRARDLRDNGTETVLDVPPVYVGGCRVNDPASPWVRVVDGSESRITHHT